MYSTKQLIMCFLSSSDITNEYINNFVILYFSEHEHYVHQSSSSQSINPIDYKNGYAEKDWHGLKLRNKTLHEELHYFTAIFRRLPWVDYLRFIFEKYKNPSELYLTIASLMGVRFITPKQGNQLVYW